MRAKEHATFDRYQAMREATLAAWRAHPCPQLAELLRTPPVAPRFERMLKFVREFPARGRLSDLLDAVRRHLRDPRLTPVLLHLAATPRDRNRLTPHHLSDFWTENGDPTGAAQMIALGAEPIAYVPLSTEERAAVDEQLRPIPLFPHLENVFREPDSTTARRVFSDVLLERGEKWGELIAIQLLSSDSVDDTLLRLELDRVLTEPFGYEVTVLELDRGFPARVRASLSLLLRVTPAWSTVRELRFDRNSEPYDLMATARFFEKPELAGLEAVWDLPVQAIRLIDRGRCQLRTLGFTLASQLPVSVEAFARLPSVDRLELTDASIAMVGEILRAPALARLELRAQGFGWRLTWRGKSAELDLALGPDDAWAELFASVPRAGHAHLHLIATGDSSAFEPLTRHFATFAITPASSDPRA